VCISYPHGPILLENTMKINGRRNEMKSKDFTFQSPTSLLYRTDKKLLPQLAAKVPKFLSSIFVLIS
jgi:hypothetical protein